MSDRLEEVVASPKMLSAIRNEVRSSIERQLNDLWMVVQSLKDGSGAAPAAAAVTPEQLAELKHTLDELTVDVGRRLRGVRKWVQEQTAAVAQDKTLLERLERLERDSGQLGAAAALFESRMAEQESRLVRRVEDAETRRSVMPSSAGVSPAGGELSTESLLALPGSVEFSLSDLAKVVIKYNASDLVVRPHSLPYTYLEGDLIPIGQKGLSALDSYRVVMLSLEPAERQQLVDERCFTKTVEYHQARFQLNAYFERGQVAAYARRLTEPTLSLDDLNVPRTVEVSLLEERGLILLCGDSGNAQRELAYALLQPINQSRRARIFTLEDAICYELKEQQSLFSQLQLGPDLPNARALTRLRPDVLYLQRISSPEDLAVALQLAGDSTLVIAGCAGGHAVSCLQNLLELVGSEVRSATLQGLASTLRSILCFRPPGAPEFLINSARVRPWLERADFAALATAVEAGSTVRPARADKGAAPVEKPPTDKVPVAPSEAAPMMPPPDTEMEIEMDSLPPPSVESLSLKPVASPSRPTTPAGDKPAAAAKDDEETLLGWL